MNNLILVVAGGRGKRLWKALPEFKKSGLPKSLGIEVGGRPLVAYQLDSLIKIPQTKIIIIFNDKKSINTFQQFEKKGKIPRFKYLFNLNKHHSDNATKDIIKLSSPHRPWQNDFKAVMIATGDVFVDSQHISKIFKIYQSEGYNVLSLSKFDKYMVSLKRHFHPVYDKRNRLKFIKQTDEIPSEIICHPQLLTKKAFKIYYDSPKGTTKSEFVNKAIAKGEKFIVLKPREYVNVNYPQDVKKLYSYFR